jgi:hypothetical protein
VRYEDFVLYLDSSSRGFRARVLKSPFGEGAVGFSLPALAGVEPAGHGSAAASRDVLRQSASSATRPAIDIGNDLFRSVFQGQVRTLLDKSLGQIERSPGLGLRLKIKLDPNDEEAGALADLPWELLCDGETDDFFALSRQMSVVRYLDVPRASQPISFTPPLRILAVGASPTNLELLDLKEEEDRLERLNQSSSGVEVKFLPHASAGAVREALSKDTFNVLHFMGHGAFDHASGEGMLAFEAPDRSADLVSGRAFATKLRDLRNLGVVVLNACETARARNQGGSNPFRGVATALVLGGVPAVVAMQRPISDLAAIGFSTAFYRNLVEGDSIDEALTEGRQAIHSARPDEYEWATPVLFLRMPEGNVFVARPAEPKPERASPALPPEPERPPIVVPAPSPASPGRGLVLKAVAGTAGAALVVFVVSTKLINTPGEVGPSDTPQQTQETPTGGVEPTPTPGTTLGRKPRTDTAPIRDKKVQEPDSEPASSAAQPVSTPPPAPSPAVSEVATADLSSLSAELQSITRTEDGLRVTVRFRNSADLPLSAVIDQDTSSLSSQGRPYSIMDSNLSSVGSNWRLDLKANSSSVHTFDFQEPILGSKEFLLTLKALDGGRVKVTGSPITLEGSP